MSDSEKRERFGRYLILDHLVDGGMAKICRARFLGEQADKVVAIKMVQPQYSKDEGFKSMFMDEIKVTFGLLHPNIVQTYDYGVHQNQLFVAMEYCDGRNLKEYLEKLKERKFVFPVEISTYIISQACQGLFYAHTFRDKLTGLEAHIIHRDISPHNIMLTFDGAIKIIDFGIAKSQKNSEATQAGTIKGKLSYLAPEYLDGLELDARYDQFALGITLWEMLCSRKLFKENNDLAILKKIQECKVPPPSSINPNVPKELDEIVLKALSKDRNNRYENLDQMNRALMKFLYAKYPDFNGTDLSYFAQELFREEIKKDREKLFEFGKIDIRPYLDEVKRESEGKGKSSNSSSSRSSESSNNTRREQVLDFGFEDTAENKKSRLKTTTGKRNTALKEKTIADNEIKKPSPENATQFTQIKRNNYSKTGSGLPPKVDKTSPGTKVGQSNLNKDNEKSTSFVPMVAMFLLVVSAGFYFYKSHLKTKPEANVANKNLKQANPNRQTASSGEEVMATHGTVILTHFDRQKMQVFIDDDKQDVDLISSFKIPLRKDIVLRVQIEGRKHFIKKLRADNPSALEVEISEMPIIPYGYVNTSSACAIGEITFELWGEKRKGRVPMTSSFGIPLPLQINTQGQPVSATHVLYFKADSDSIERKIEITISREDESIDLCEKL